MTFSREYCPVCKKEMRIWISNKKCLSMCVNDNCSDSGIVNKTIPNINNFSIDVSIKI